MGKKKSKDQGKKQKKEKGQVIKCPICGVEVKKPLREWDLGSWALTYIKEYECCDRKFRVYVRKPKESLGKESPRGRIRIVGRPWNGVLRISRGREEEEEEEYLF